jgi:hypothetical protein
VNPRAGELSTPRAVTSPPPGSRELDTSNAPVTSPPPGSRELDTSDASVINNVAAVEFTT